MKTWFACVIFPAQNFPLIDNALVGFLSISIWPNSFEPNKRTPVPLVLSSALIHSCATLISCATSLDSKVLCRNRSSSSVPQKNFDFRCFSSRESGYFFPTFRSSKACLIMINSSSCPPLSAWCFRARVRNALRISFLDAFSGMPRIS